MQRWYALYTKSGQEGVVARQLEERGFEAFYPHYTERRRGEPARVRPLFPCYLFARVDLEQVGLSALAWTPGLRYLVSFGGVPARVPEEAVMLVRRRLAEVEARGSLWPARPRFRAGETVRITEGPLAGLEGVFDRALGPGERVQVLLRFLGEVNRVQVSASALEAVASPRGHSRRTRGRGRGIGGWKLEVRR